MASATIQNEPSAFCAMVLGGLNINADAVYAECRENAPIFYSEAVQAWVLTRYEDVNRALTDEAVFGGPLQYGAQPGAAIHGRVLLHMGGEEHRKKAGMISTRLRSPRSVRGPLAGMVEATTRRLLDALPVAPRTADMKRYFCEPLPLEVITALIDVHEASQFREWYEAISGAGGGNPCGDPVVAAAGMTARDELYAFFAPLIQQRRTMPGDDLLSDLCSTEYEGERMTDEEIKAFMSFLLVAGVETTARVTGSLLRELIAHADQWRLLVDDPALVTSAAAEAVRMHPPHHATKREVRAPVELHGQRLMPGDVVLAVMGAGNQDETVFPNARCFDVTRFRDNANAQFVSASAHSAFGGGRHFCTGSLLAKLEMTHALNGLLECFERMEFSGGGPPPDRGWPLRGPGSLHLLLYPRRDGPSTHIDSSGGAVE